MASPTFADNSRVQKTTRWGALFLAATVFSPNAVSPPTASLTLTAFAPNVLTAATAPPEFSRTQWADNSRVQKSSNAIRNWLLAVGLPASQNTIAPPSVALAITAFPPAAIIQATPIIPGPPTFFPEETAFYQKKNLDAQFQALNQPGNNAINVNVSTLALTAFAPTITAQGAVSVPALGMTLTAFPPDQITQTFGGVVNVPPLSMQMAAFAPDVGVQGSVFPPTANLTMTALAPLVVQTSLPADLPWPAPPTITNLPCRGVWVFPGSARALWIFGNGAYLMKAATPPSGFTPATFTVEQVGTLATNDGRVSIRDDGVGHFAVVVDGANGYLYSAVDSSFSKIADPAFLGADTVAFIDGWWIFNQPGTQVFYTNASTYSTAFNGSNFALKDGASDVLVSLIENKEELWLIGERTTEIWYDAGGQYFAFQRLVSTMLQVGCAAKHSVSRFSAAGQDGLVWLARSDRGENVVVRTEGFSVKVISTPAVSDEIAKYALVSDATGDTYQEDGHEFYVLTFPTADVTWVYDSQTDMWHKRASYDPYSNTYHRMRAAAFVNFQNQRLVGDYQNGSIYRLTREAYTDAGWPLVAWRRTPHVWDGGARERVYMASLQIEFAPGVGTQINMGSDPQAVLQISRDGGVTWSQQFKRGLGKVGAYLNRVIWRRLSFSRDTVVDVKVIDPVKRDVVGANLKRFSE
jgi:hypothetical protein